MRRMFIQFELRDTSMSTEAARRVQMCEEQGLCRFCLEPLLPGERVVRKCHERCDQVNRRGVLTGEWTDEGQQRAGYWGAPGLGGRPSRRPTPMPTAQPNTEL